MSVFRIRLLIVCLLNILQGTVAAFAGPDDLAQAYKKALANPNDETALNHLLAALPSIRHPLILEKLYVLEGDLGMTKSQVQAYLFRINTSVDPLEGRSLVNLDLNGKMTYWETPAERKLRYAVFRSSFPDDDTYAQVVSDIAKAGQDWRIACQECGIEFIHAKEYDSMALLSDFGPLAQSDELRFVATYSDQGGRFIAQAFFPGEPWNRRLLLVDRSYFHLSGGAFTGRGVMRHELGHVLGFRHEQIQGIKGCALEDGNWKPLTKYDPHSVMHYFCGAGGSQALEISNLDREGLRVLYGKPPKR